MERMLDEVRKFVAPEMVFGQGALELAGRYALNLGARRVLVVTDPGLRRAGWLDPLLRSLGQAGLGSVVFDQVTPNPKDHEVMAGAALYRLEGCDVIVALGGGSPMDCAKGIGVCATSGRHVLEFEGVDEVASPGPPLICVPTTSGTAADISQFAIINDSARHVKIAVISKTMVPDLALIDPLTTWTMEPALTAATGLDALTHAIEAYVSNAASPFTDLHALEAIRLVARHLEGAVAQPRDPAHRAGMALASTYAGMAFSNASLGLVHAMAHSLGGMLDLPHGLCNALLLDHVIDTNWEASAERYTRVSQEMGCCGSGATPDEARATLLRGLRDLRGRLGMTKGLAALGVGAGHLEQLSRFAAQDPCLATNPLVLDEEGIRAVFQSALEDHAPAS